MRIEVSLSPKATEFKNLQNDLSQEFGSLTKQGVQVSTRSVPPPAGTLYEDQIIQFILEHGGDALQFATAIVELITAKLLMRKEKKDKKDPPIVVVVDDKRLDLPASSDKTKKFLKSIGQQGSAKSSKKPTSNRSKNTKRGGK